MAVPDFLELLLEDDDSLLQIACCDLLIIDILLLLLLLIPFSLPIPLLAHGNFIRFGMTILIRRHLGVFSVCYLLARILLNVGITIIINLRNIIQIFLSLLVDVVGHDGGIEDIHIFFKLRDDETSVFIVEDSHVIGGLAEGILGLDHEIVKLFFDLIGWELLDNREVSFQGVELFAHLLNIQIIS